MNSQARSETKQTKKNEWERPQDTNLVDSCQCTHALFVRHTETLHSISGKSDVPICKVVDKANKLGYDCVKSVSITKFLSDKFHKRVVGGSNPTIELILCLEVRVRGSLKIFSVFAKTMDALLEERARIIPR